MSSEPVTLRPEAREWLRESIAVRRRQTLTVFIAPFWFMMLFIGVSIWLLWKQDKSVTQADEKVHELSQSLRATHSADAASLQASTLEDSVGEMTDLIRKVSLRLDAYPGNTIETRFNGIMDDYDSTSKLLSESHLLVAGDRPVYQSVQSLIATAKKTTVDTGTAGTEIQAAKPDNGCHLASANRDTVVFFPLNSAGLTPPEREIIDSVAQSWKMSHAKDTIKVQGFADPSGGERVNLALSQMRARAVVDELKGRVGSQNVTQLKSNGSRETPSYKCVDIHNPEYRRVVVISFR